MIKELNGKIAQTTMPIYLFGAHIFSQYLIGFGLETTKIKNILDNGPAKQGKRLYGTKLMVVSPKVLKDIGKAAVILISSFATSISTNTVSPTFPPITISSIYNSDHSWTATLSASKLTTVVNTGDIMLGRTINSKAIETNNFEYPFLPTKTFLTSADISFVNLETPILKNCPIKPTGTVFCASASWISAIENSGIDVLSLANNHTLDHQKAGFDETLSLLLSQNLWVTGSDFDVVKEVNGVKFGFSVNCHSFLK
jgi:hypothetical protein